MMMREQVAQDVAAQVAELDGQILMQRGALGYARMVLERGGEAQPPAPSAGGEGAAEGEGG